ncbi:MAG: dihydroorotase [Lachnospiraceae bacterium]|nr:dihydroorotase [Lachnospiraceae bacterium]
MNILIKGGTVINPATNMEEEADVFISHGLVEEIGKNLSDEFAEEIIDAHGCFVCPGFVDLHVHLRDPGQTHKGDIATESKAASRGGYTTIFAMPNTTPVVDKEDMIEYVQMKGNDVGLVEVRQVGAITEGMEGEVVSDMEGMMDGGCIAFSEDGKSVMDSGVLREAMQIAKNHDVLIMSHCEDKNLVWGGVMNAGKKAEELGLPGITNAVENIIVARDLMLAEETGARVHLCHCSTKESVEMLAAAKKKGANVSGEVCPHHFTLSEKDIPGADDANFKMNPPLRTKKDVEALKGAISVGTIEAISTDHAPHSEEEKAQGFLEAPFGIVGMETAAALTYTNLVLGGYISPMGMISALSTNPARIAKIDRGDISVGKTANITIFDPSFEYEIHASDLAGPARNMPYEGMKVNGRVVGTILKGKITYRYVD